MKILNDFVTNSSSSSFVVSVKSDENFKYESLPEGMKRFFEVLFGKPIDSEEKLIRNMYENYFGGVPAGLSKEYLLKEFDEEPYLKEKLDTALLKLKEGNVIFTFSLDWSDTMDDITNAIKELEKDNLAEIVEVG